MLACSSYFALLLSSSARPQYENELQPMRPAGFRWARHLPEGDSRRALAGTVTLLISNETIANNGRVTVSVLNQGTPTSRQWLAAYSPANSDITKCVPAKYAVLAEVQPSYLQTGKADVSFQLPNLRADWGFVF